VRDVIRIFAAISHEVPSRLVLVGDGPDRPEAAAEADLLGIADQVLFLGKQDSVAELLVCADLFLLPSESESFGLVALEAMASRVPVIATAVGGLPEVVEHGETGFLAAVGDVQGMAEAGVRILRDDELWRRMGEAARERAGSRFSTEQVIPLYERYYDRVLERESAGAPAGVETP
jgi:L-malate glycosyltransferase